MANNRVFGRVTPGTVPKAITDAYARHNGVVKPVNEIWARRSNGQIEKLWPLLFVVQNFYSVLSAIEPDPSAEISFNTNGTTTGTTTQPNWFSQVITGIGSGYFIRWRPGSIPQSVNVSGTLSTDNFYFQINQNRNLVFNSATSAQVTGFIDIATDSGGSNVVTSSLEVFLEAQ